MSSKLQNPTSEIRKIAFIAPFGLQPKATTSARLLPLAAALAAHGHQVRVIVPPYDDPTAPAAGRRTVLEGVAVVELPRPPAVPGGGVVGWTAGLVRAALAGQPDVIHVGKPKGYSGLAGWLLSALGRPWVLDTDDWEGAGGWNRRNPYSAPQRALFAAQEATLPRLARAVTVASRTLQTQVWGLGVPPARVFYLPNGVARAKYDPWLAAAADPAAQAAARARWGLPPAPDPAAPVILLYTRFVEFPVEWPLRVLRAVAARVPGVRLLVVGSGFFGEEQRLLAAARRAGLADRLILCGAVPPGDLGPLLTAADVALYPMRDTLINRAKCSAKLLDLMVLARPVVTHRVGQQGEYLQHGESGWLADPGDVAGLAAGVLRLLADPALAARLGAAAATRAWDHFSWSHLSAAAEAAYRGW
jgi:glycosyltransferase involved in cell wall biosynthesis